MTIGSNAIDWRHGLCMQIPNVSVVMLVQIPPFADNNCINHTVPPLRERCSRTSWTGLVGISRGVKQYGKSTRGQLEAANV